jgi:hypothetical protein
VTNGELTVGPVVTGLLLRGIDAGRIPDYCHVRTFRGSWRSLVSIREINARARNDDTKREGQEVAEWIQSLERIRDEMEFCHTATWLALVATGAESAMFHYRGRGARSLVTRSVIGPISKERLGYALNQSDPVLRVARLGRPVTGPPYGPIEDALAMRFASSAGGAGSVAMIPMFTGGHLTAMLELSRPGHAFRRADLQRAERIVHRVLRQRGQAAPFSYN